MKGCVVYRRWRYSSALYVIVGLCQWWCFGGDLYIITLGSGAFLAQENGNIVFSILVRLGLQNLRERLIGYLLICTPS